MKTIKKIVLTGGPCSGKTTFTTRAQQVFSERGYRVIIDNESATDLITGGISPATMGMYEFQKYCVALQLKKEELCYKAAQEIEGEKVLIVIDRGIFDDMAYVGEEAFKEILKEFDLTLDEINPRYDMVLHLLTSAKGKEEAYTFANNAARYETVEQARAMDDMALQAWESHPNRVIIGNETDFEIKMIKAIQSVFEYLGEGSPIERFSKYLINVDEELLNKISTEACYSTSHIIQHYLKPENGYERRIRMRQTGDAVMYSYSDANYLSTNERIKTDRVLTQKQYNDYLNMVDKNLNVLDKTRYSFINDDFFYKLDVFAFDKTKGILSVDVPSDGREVKTPDYVNVIKEVSDDVNFKNYYLAGSQRFPL